MKMSVTLGVLMAMSVSMLVFMVMILFNMMVLRIVMVMMIVVVMLVLLLPLHHNIEFHRTEIRPRYSRHLQLITLDRQLAQFGLQIIEPETEIQKRADRHIAADTGEAVEVERLHPF